MFLVSFIWETDLLILISLFLVCDIIKQDVSFNFPVIHLQEWPWTSRDQTKSKHNDVFMSFFRAPLLTCSRHSKKVLKPFKSDRHSATYLEVRKSQEMLNHGWRRFKYFSCYYNIRFL